MIKINLLGNDTAVDYGKQIAVGAYVASIAASLIVFYVLYSGTSSDIDLKTQEFATKEIELKRWQAKTQEVKDLEVKQKELEERLIRIAMLKRNKQGPVHIMDTLNKSIPERAWVVEAREKGGEMRLDGFAIDGETVSEFMRTLESSDYFPKILDVATEQVTKDGVKIQKFSLNTQLSYAGKVSTLSPESSEAKGEKK